MNNRRPKKHKTVTSEQACRLRRKWRKWISPIARDIGQGLLNYETFEDLREIFRVNPQIQEPYDFQYWLTSNYAAAFVMSLRRYDDIDKRSQSLGRILYEMLETPGIMTRRAHKALYKTSPFMADPTFDNIAGAKRAILGPQAILSDLVRIEKACTRARRFANKRVAHVASRGAIRVPPSFENLKLALDEVEAVAKKYIVLLTGINETSLKSERQYDWTEVFLHPWIKDRKVK